MSTAYSTEHLHNGYAAGVYANGHNQQMDGRQGEYPRPGLSSPYHSYSEHNSEASSADQNPAAAYNQAPDVKFNPSATPTSDYSLNPSSARSQTFPDYMPRAQYPDGTQRYQPADPHGSNGGNMAQAASPSMNLHDGQSHNHPDANDANSDPEIPVDPSISQTSPTYAQPHHYSPYPQPHEMPHYQAPPGAYHPGYGAPPQGYPMPTHYAHVPTSVTSPSAMVAGPRPPGGGHPLSTVYSFVPIPGTHQQKRPRRRYEEIERMYKCGWNGCEKAYGTLNHLNAHVTMQSHGAKRTPDEFKEIRKEWKARKKEEDSQRKVDDERHRQSVGSQHQSPVDSQSGADVSQHQSPIAYPAAGRPHLPPLGYTAAGQVPPQYGQPGTGMDGMPQYAGGPMPTYGFPQSPYAQNPQMYQPSHSPTHGHDDAVPPHE